MLTEHLNTIEMALQIFYTMQESRIHWGDLPAPGDLPAIDAALTAIRQEREGGAWEPVWGGEYGEHDGERIQVKSGEIAIQFWTGQELQWTWTGLPNNFALCRRTQSPASQQEAMPAQDGVTSIDNQREIEK